VRLLPLNEQIQLFTMAEAAKVRVPKQISKKRKFIADGVFKAELNEFLIRELAEEGFV
jgi:hypothetical protein